VNPNFTLIETMTDAGQSWAGETRPISPELLANHLASLHGPIYYVTGPPDLVGAMQKMLHSAGVDDDDIRPEEFSGY
jgi:Na+-transporting NADH:ubiquinone oxidoreductase subunit NqrF